MYIMICLFLIKSSFQFDKDWLLFVSLRGHYIYLCTAAWRGVAWRDGVSFWFLLGLGPWYLTTRCWTDLLGDMIRYLGAFWFEEEMKRLGCVFVSQCATIFSLIFFFKKKT